MRIIRFHVQNEKKKKKYAYPCLESEACLCCLYWAPIRKYRKYNLWFLFPTSETEPTHGKLKFKRAFQEPISTICVHYAVQNLGGWNLYLNNIVQTTLEYVFQTLRNEYTLLLATGSRSSSTKRFMHCTWHIYFDATKAFFHYFPTWLNIYADPVPWIHDRRKISASVLALTLWPENLDCVFFEEIVEKRKITACGDIASLVRRCSLKGAVPEPGYGSWFTGIVPQRAG